MYVHEGSSNIRFNYVPPSNLDHSHVSPMCSPPSLSPESYFEMHGDSPMICDSNVDLGYKHNAFNMLGGKIDNFLSL